VALGLYEGVAVTVIVAPDGTLSAPHLSSQGITVGRYGPDGEALAPVSSSTDVRTDGPPDAFMLSRHAAVDRSGGIVLTLTDDETRPPSLLLRRFRMDGTEDTVFASTYSPDRIGQGSRPTPRPSSPYTPGVAVDTTGRIVVAGSSEAGMTVWRFNPDGTPDLVFGEDGAVSWNNTVSVYKDVSAAVAIDDTGRLFVTGMSFVEQNAHAMAVWCFTTEGQPDSGFGEDGRVVTRVSRSGHEIQTDGRAIQIDSESRIVVLGRFDSHPAVWRYLSDGTPDDTFGGTGCVALEDLDPKLGVFWGRATIRDSSGRIVVAGNLTVCAEYDAAVCRLNPDGSLDLSFGVDGMVSYDCNQGFRGMR
jgi:uncharacterized delta-60 repeat protein